MNDTITLITGIDEKQRKRVLCWSASLPEAQHIEIFKEAVKIAYQLKNDHHDIPGKVGKYCAYILSSRRAGWDTLNGKGFRVAVDKQFDDFSRLRRTKVAELLTRGRTPILKRRVLAFWGVVVELKAEGLGFRTISDYLQKTHKIKVSPAYLTKLWKETLTNERL